MKEKMPNTTEELIEFSSAIDFQIVLIPPQSSAYNYYISIGKISESKTINLSQ